MRMWDGTIRTEGTERIKKEKRGEKEGKESEDS